MVEELGAGRLLHGRIAGAECVLALGSGAEQGVEGELAVRIPPDSIHLFDAASGARLASPRSSLAAQ